MDKQLKFAAWAGIAAVLIDVFLRFIAAVDALNGGLLMIEYLAGLVVLYGFYRIAKKQKLVFLKIISITLISAVILSSVLMALLLKFISPDKLVSSFGVLGAIPLVVSLLGLVFGIAVLSLRKKFGKLVWVISLCYIIPGIIFGIPYLTNISALISALLMVSWLLSLVQLVASSILLFKASKIY